MRHLVLTCLCTLTLAAPAAAQDPQLDPGSPAGTEYQLPVDRARQQAGPGASAGSEPSTAGDTSGTAPLFGAGVGPEQPPSSGVSNPRSTDTQPGIDSAAAPPVGAEPDAVTRTPQTMRAQAASPEGGSGALASAGGAGGVLLLGGLAGLAWRRRAARR